MRASKQSTTKFNPRGQAHFCLLNPFWGKPRTQQCTHFVLLCDCEVDDEGRNVRPSFPMFLHAEKAAGAV